MLDTYAQCLEGDCENGTGTFECDCGYVFEGEFKNGQKVKGVLTKKELVYTGEFKNDMAEGYGTIRYKDGSWYEGMFKANAPHGFGTYYFTSGRTYVGEMKEGYFGGFGVLITEDHDGNILDQQIGMFSKDRLNGYGCILASGGDIYFGSLEDGDYKGFGVFVYGKNKRVEAGMFKKNRLTENVVLNNYPSLGSFAVKDFVDTETTYNLSGNIDGNNLLLRVKNSKSEYQLVYFDHPQKLIFISAFGDEFYGTAITLKGEIYSAMYSPNAANPVTFETKKYVK